MILDFAGTNEKVPRDLKRVFYDKKKRVPTYDIQN
jgi:hypothetical protein